MKQKLSQLTLAILLTSCGQSNLSKNETTNEKVSEPKKENIEKIASYDCDVLKFDSVLYNGYRNLIDSSSAHEKKIIEKIISNMEKHSKSNSFYEIRLIDEIDNNLGKDTLLTRLCVKNKEITVTYLWYKNKKLIWTDTITAPYMWIADNELFNYDTKGFWAKYTIAKDYSIPEVNSLSDYKNIEEEWILLSGLNHLKTLGYNVSREDYLEYIKTFKGKLLIYGHPVDSKLMIWFEPAKAFIEYYRG